jgi:RNA polymerase primary sigma factor
MYLREMGGVELLSREGENCNCQKNRSRKRCNVNRTCTKPNDSPTFFEWNDQLQKDEILVREIIDIDTNYMEDESTGPSAKQKNAGETDKEEGSK